MAITILLIIAGALAFIAGGWFVFEHFWNRRLFGGRDDSGPVKNAQILRANSRPQPGPTVMDAGRIARFPLCWDGPSVS